MTRLVFLAAFAACAAIVLLADAPAHPFPVEEPTPLELSPQPADVPERPYLLDARKRRRLGPPIA